MMECFGMGPKTEHEVYSYFIPLTRSLVAILYYAYCPLTSLPHRVRYRIIC